MLKVMERNRHKKGKGNSVEDLPMKPSISDDKLKQRTKNFTEFLSKNLKIAKNRKPEKLRA